MNYDLADWYTGQSEKFMRSGMIIWDYDIDEPAPDTASTHDGLPF